MMNWTEADLRFAAHAARATQVDRAAWRREPRTAAGPWRQIEDVIARARAILVRDRSDRMAAAPSTDLVR